MIPGAPPALESRPCPLGCPPADVPVLVGRDRLHHLPGEFQVVRCRTCSLLRTDPRPTPAAMGAYYPDEYGPYLGTRVGTAMSCRPLWRRAVAATLGRIVDTGGESLPALVPGSLLEIGCASGAFLHRMAARGWQVEGVEPSPAAAAEARSLGYTVHEAPLESIPRGLGPFDLVVGWMVLEHLHEPVHALRRLRESTRPGGWLVASVPNAASWELKVFGERWYALHLPNHLWHPTPRTARATLERAGWSLRRIVFHRDMRNVVGSLGYVARDRGGWPRLAEWLARYPERGRWGQWMLLPFAWGLAALGQTGRMTLWAQRADEAGCASSR